MSSYALELARQRRERQEWLNSEESKLNSRPNAEPLRTPSGPAKLNFTMLANDNDFFRTTL
jgi:hypothetical protein